MRSFKYFVFLPLLCLCLIECGPSNFATFPILPYPQKIKAKSGTIDISCGLHIQFESPNLGSFGQVINKDFQVLFAQFTEAECSPIDLVLKIDQGMAQEAFRLDIEDDIHITGGSYQALSHGITTIWQLSDEQGVLPRLSIKDQPNYGYRSIMLDVARAWHEPATIRTIIDLCRWYKINYLHLHLTDDSAFTFPSSAYPDLATQDHHYTRNELIELNKYAFERGVTLVPEIDVPGHSSQFIKKMPEVFGIDDPTKNSYTISMAREDTDKALGVLFQEVAAIFTHSPYIHIGGDEAFFEGMENDATTQAYMRKHQLPNLHELFRHFLIRMNEAVKKAGKQTILWAGFGQHGELAIPKDMIVMLWESVYHHPDSLIAEGFPVINASFKPLYVVNNRKWDPLYIYEHWNPKRWESWANDPNSYTGIEVAKNKQVMGATLCAWEQHQINQLPRLRNRVASMSERLWSEKFDVNDFAKRQKKSDAKLSKFLRPFEVAIDGLVDTTLSEGNFYEHLWFRDVLNISASSPNPQVKLKYSLVKNPVAEDWKSLDAPLTITTNVHLRIRAYDQNDRPLGHQYYQRFFLMPIVAKTTGLIEALPIGSWEKQRFEHSATIALSSTSQQGQIRYTIDGSAVQNTSLEYERPITIDSTSQVRAMLFDQEGIAIGGSFSEKYYKLWPVPSLTTNKPIKASNELTSPGLARKANNGRASLWEQWGDHKSLENWVQVDLEKEAAIRKLQVFTFWDNYRYYQYTIEGSLDGVQWQSLVDFSENEILSSPQGYLHEIKPTPVRYLKINMLYNSANPGLHLIEFAAWD